jgi:cation transport ATPase
MAFFVPALVSNKWDDFIVILEFLLVTVVARLGLLLINKYLNGHRYVEIGLELVMLLTVVFAFGWVFKWYTLEYIWIIPAMVIPAYLIGNVLDIIKMRQDVAYINQQIQFRKKRLNVKTDRNEEDEAK